MLADKAEPYNVDGGGEQRFDQVASKSGRGERTRTLDVFGESSPRIRLQIVRTVCNYEPVNGQSRGSPYIG